MKHASTQPVELTDAELDQIAGGVIAIIDQGACDGSVTVALGGPDTHVTIRLETVGDPQIRTSVGNVSLQVT